jgi:hypothetical protein
MGPSAHASDDEVVLLPHRGVSLVDTRFDLDGVAIAGDFGCGAGKPQLLLRAYPDDRPLVTRRDRFAVRRDERNGEGDGE